jgi:hypothetical protein
MNRNKKYMAFLESIVEDKTLLNTIKKGFNACMENANPNDLIEINSNESYNDWDLINEYDDGPIYNDLLSIIAPYLNAINSKLNLPSGTKPFELNDIITLYCMIDAEDAYYREGTDFVEQAIIRINSDKGIIDINIPDDHLIYISELIQNHFNTFDNELQKMANDRYDGPFI